MRLAIVFVLTMICQDLFSQVPVITSFSPASGPIGTTVIISGANFSTNNTSNIVYFGAVKASVSSASSTSLSITVPAGASFQPITVTVNGLTTFSSKPFIVTFTGGGSAFAQSSFAPKIDFPAGSSTSGITSSDLDGDGKPDIAAVMRAPILCQSLEIPAQPVLLLWNPK